VSAQQWYYYCSTHATPSLLFCKLLYIRAIPISACQTAPPPRRRRRCFLRVQINRILIPHRLFPGKKITITAAV